MICHLRHVCRNCLNMQCNSSTHVPKKYQYSHGIIKKIKRRILNTYQLSLTGVNHRLRIFRTEDWWRSWGSSGCVWAVRVWCRALGFIKTNLSFKGALEFPWNFLWEEKTSYHQHKYFAKAMKKKILQMIHEMVNRPEALWLWVEIDAKFSPSSEQPAFRQLDCFVDIN